MCLWPFRGEVKLFVVGLCALERADRGWAACSGVGVST